MLGRELGPSMFGLGGLLGGGLGGLGGGQPISIMASMGGPEHTFLLLDAPMGLGNLGNLDPYNPHSIFTGSAGRAFSRGASRGASASASPAAPAPMREVASSERADGRALPSRPSRRAAAWGTTSRPASGGIRLPPMQRSSRASASAEPERPPERSQGRSQGASSSSSSSSSSVRAAAPPPATTPLPPPRPPAPANPRRSFLPSLRSVAGVLPRLSSTSSRPRSNNATPITGAGTSLSAAGSGRSFAARTRAIAARRRSSGTIADEDCVVL